VPQTYDPAVIIDAQVHAYERDHPGRPWIGTLAGPPEVTGDDMVRAMDDVGVDGALLVSPWSMYRYDASYAVDVGAAHPGRFGLIRPFDPDDPDVGRQVADWAARPGVVGARLMLARRDRVEADHPGVAAIAAEAGRAGLPLNVLCWGLLDVVDRLARANPETRIVIDHLGLAQPFTPPVPPEPWADLPLVLALARHPNVVIKITGACTLATEPFPFPDIWDPLSRIFDAFGLDRCLWGTDWTRATELISYREAVEAFLVTDRLSDDDRRQLMAGTLTSVYGWAPTGDG
jgi:predicted TIM-barrel fold metal-dependent hydrolase